MAKDLNDILREGGNSAVNDVMNKITANFEEEFAAADEEVKKLQEKKTANPAANPAVNAQNTPKNALNDNLGNFIPQNEITAKNAATGEIRAFDKTIAEYFNTDFSNFVDSNKQYKNRKTGFENLDEELQGLPPSIVIIAGVPAVGKTSFTLQLTEQMARQGEPAIFITLEQSKGFIHSKILAREINQIEGYPKTDALPMTAKHVMQGDIYEHGDAYKKALQNFSDADFNLRIWQVEKPNIDEILKRLETFCAKYPKAVIALDYFQLFGTGAENIKAKLDEVMHKLINFRRKFDVTFLIVSSINRAGYNVDSGLSSLKETGGLEYSADYIFFLQLLTDEGKPAMQGDIFKAAKQLPRQVQLKCLKNRYGGLFDIGFFYYSAAEIFKPNLEYGEFIEHADHKKNKSTTPADDGDGLKKQF